MIAYTGIETISNMAEEAKDAARTIPRSVGLVVVAVLGLYLLIPIVALSAMPVTQDSAGHFSTALGSEFANDPILGIVENLGLGAGLTEVLRFYVGILAAVILLIATNAGLIGVSGSPTRWASTGSSPRGCDRCTRATGPPTSRSSSSPRWR